MRRRTINGFPIAFHLNSRLDKLEARWKTIQLLQDELLEKFTEEITTQPPKQNYDRPSQTKHGYQ